MTVKTLPKIKWSSDFLNNVVICGSQALATAFVYECENHGIKIAGSPDDLPASEILKCIPSDIFGQLTLAFAIQNNLLYWTTTAWHTSECTFVNVKKYIENNEKGATAMNTTTPCKKYADFLKDYTFEKVAFFNKKTRANSFKWVTTLTFNNGDTVSAEVSEDVDPSPSAYVGFMIALAKYMSRSNRNDNINFASYLADYWINEKPEIDKRNAARAEKKAAEAKRMDEIKANRMRKKQISRAARKRKMEYDAALLACQKYGVPMDFEPDDAKS